MTDILFTIGVAAFLYYVYRSWRFRRLVKREYQRHLKGRHIIDGDGHQ